MTSTSGYYNPRQIHDRINFYHRAMMFPPRDEGAELRNPMIDQIQQDHFHGPAPEPGQQAPGAQGPPRPEAGAAEQSPSVRAPPSWAFGSVSSEQQPPSLSTSAPSTISTISNISAPSESQPPSLGTTAPSTISTISNISAGSDWSSSLPPVPEIPPHPKKPTRASQDRAATKMSTPRPSRQTEEQREQALYDPNPRYIASHVRHSAFYDDAMRHLPGGRQRYRGRARIDTILPPPNRGLVWGNYYSKQFGADKSWKAKLHFSRKMHKWGP